ncbi:Phenolphthiocerol synthesis polyketide synthase type I Pks15/1 [Streptomyces sp. ADI95-16]|uniref:NADP-dependent oxidoreductase n=1 Tax=Streptomyces sp. ADI95-16 TaxID=1522758 RepID=UPI000F3A924C|nr:NADP-dependent oxidoreductase [Streptomyces sp. ADI95-16]AYV25208.1 Phenolphthiocerol synthesis polyketide synthase type I Pks15/1 [Streptomyces sp. ADI95-16]
MKAAVINHYGQVHDVVRVTDVPVPAVGPRDVLIEVRAAGVNPVDHLIVKGFLSTGEPSRPLVIGNELAGVVTQVGAEATRFAVGDEVFSRVDPRVGGAFAEYVAVDESLVAAKPSRLTFEEAASLPLVALTALQALTEQADVRSGTRVLIHGGAGGVGSAAVQIAKQLGAEVVATAGSGSVELVRELGADRVIDYRTEKFEEVVSDVDVVLDTIGGETQERSFGVLKSGGTLVSIVAVPDVEVKKARWNVEARSFFMRPQGEQLAHLAGLVESGQLRPIVETVFPLDEASEALQKVERGGARGKTVISVRR